MKTLALHATIFLALTAATWRKWPHPLIDFGRELYVPWRITRGDVLYRDIATLFGPLSAYLNAGFFTLFGVSLTTLVVCNLAILALTLAGIHWLLKRAAGASVANIGTVAVVVLFGFSHHLTIGNYNFVTPYSHEATHGMALSVAMLVAFQRAVERRSLRWMALSGFCFGLVTLTKPEIGLAAAAGAGTGLCAVAGLGPDYRRTVARAAAAFVMASTAGPLSFFIYFSARLPSAEAVRATAGAWSPLWAPALVDQSFYLQVSGLDRPWANGGLMLLMFGACVAFVVAVAWVARVVVARTGLRAAALARFVSWVGLLVVAMATPWLAIPRAFPLTTALILAWSVARFWRTRHDPALATGTLPMLTWSAFGLALLAKIGLSTRLAHYGFCLALPATTLVIAGLITLVPDWLAQRYSADVADYFRRMARWAIVAGMVPYALLSVMAYRSKVVPIGTGGDLFYASNYESAWEGAAAREGLQAIVQWSEPGEKVAVLPEGVMLNHLARRESPLRVLNVMPPELAVFGEQDVLTSLERGRPALVVLIRKDMTEYGYPPFGTDARYGRAITSWIDAHYEPVRKISRDPRSGEFRMLVLRRRTAEPAASSQ